MARGRDSSQSTTASQPPRFQYDSNGGLQRPLGTTSPHYEDVTAVLGIYSDMPVSRLLELGDALVYMFYFTIRVEVAGTEPFYLYGRGHRAMREFEAADNAWLQPPRNWLATGQSEDYLTDDGALRFRRLRMDEPATADPEVDHYVLWIEPESTVADLVKRRQELGLRPEAAVLIMESADPHKSRP